MDAAEAEARRAVETAVLRARGPVDRRVALAAAAASRARVAAMERGALLLIASIHQCIGSTHSEWVGNVKKRLISLYQGIGGLRWKTGWDILIPGDWLGNWTNLPGICLI